MGVCDPAGADDTDLEFAVRVDFFFCKMCGFEFVKNR
jgi:hypothetical protein